MSNPQYSHLKNYVNAASDLAEQVQKDITKDQIITNETIVKLSKFFAAAERFQKGLEVISTINSDQH